MRVAIEERRASFRRKLIEFIECNAVFIWPEIRGGRFSPTHPKPDDNLARILGGADFKSNDMQIDKVDDNRTNIVRSMYLSVCCVCVNEQHEHANDWKAKKNDNPSFPPSIVVGAVFVNIYSLKSLRPSSSAIGT